MTVVWAGRPGIDSRHLVFTGSGVHPASYGMGALYPDVKVAWAWSWPLIST